MREGKLCIQKHTIRGIVTLQLINAAVISIGTGSPFSSKYLVSECCSDII
jgi:hypothetical protein